MYNTHEYKHVFCHVYNTHVLEYKHEYMSKWVHEYMSTQVHKYMSTQVHEYTSKRVHKYTSTQVNEYRSTWVHIREYKRVHEYTSSTWLQTWVHKYKYTNTRVHEYMGYTLVPEYMSTLVVHEYASTQVHEYTSTNMCFVMYTTHTIVQTCVSSKIWATVGFAPFQFFLNISATSWNFFEIFEILLVHTIGNNRLRINFFLKFIL